LKPSYSKVCVPETSIHQPICQKGGTSEVNFDALVCAGTISGIGAVKGAVGGAVADLAADVADPIANEVGKDSEEEGGEGEEQADVKVDAQMETPAEADVEVDVADDRSALEPRTEVKETESELAEGGIESNAKAEGQ
jgi:hypothetical protein